MKLIGPADLTKYKLMCEFALNTSEMLAHLNDILVPRDFEQMTADCFKEIRKLLESSAEPPKA